MKRLILLLTIVILLSYTSYAATIVVPTGSDSIANGNKFTEALNNAQPGDTIILQAGATYATIYGFFLPYKSPVTGTDADTIMIITSDISGIPPEGVRVNPSIHAAAMPKLVSKGSYPVLQTVPKSHHWKFVGIEATTDGSSQAPIIINLGPYTSYADRILMKHFVFDRCYVHPAEVAAANPITPESTSAAKAIGAGVVDFQLLNSYVLGGGPIETYGGETGSGMAFLSDSGPGPILLENNYFEAFYSPLFLGGADQDPIPERTATIISGTFNRTILHSGTARGGTDRTIILDADASPIDGTYVNHTIYISGGNDVRGNHRLINDYNGTTKVASVQPYWQFGVPDTTSTFDIVSSTDPMTGTAVLDRIGDMVVGDYVAFQLRPIPQSPAHWWQWGVGEITDIDGSTNTVKFLGLQGNSAAGFDKEPMPGGRVQWRGSVVHDITVRHNTIVANGPQFKYFIGTRYSKNWFEVKQAYNLTIEGNYFTTGIPTNLVLYPQNENGGTPWGDVSHVIIKNNVFHNYAAGINMAFAANYSPRKDSSHDILINNNLYIGAKEEDCVYGGPNFIGILDRGKNIIITHNTILSKRSPAYTASPGPQQMIVKDNIMYNGPYGWSCVEGGTWSSKCYSSTIMTNNVIVDNRDYKDPALLSSIYPPGNYYIDDDSEIGFADLSNGNYTLREDSQFKQKASDGKDMGADMKELEAALAGLNYTTKTQPPINPIPGDVNQDRIVNIKDIQEIIKDFGKTANYNELADQNNDHKIDLLDVMIVVKNWGRAS